MRCDACERAVPETHSYNVLRGVVYCRRATCQREHERLAKKNEQRTLNV